MRFVSEFVPENQKDKFDPEVFNLGPAFPPTPPYRWVVDKERDIFLISTGRQGSGGGQGDGFIPPVFFTFSFQKQLIKFGAEITALGSKDKELTINWLIVGLKIPGFLESKQEELLRVLKEAIEIHQTSTGKHDENIIAVNIAFK